MSERRLCLGVRGVRLGQQEGCAQAPGESLCALTLDSAETTSAVCVQLLGGVRVWLVVVMRVSRGWQGSVLPLYLTTSLSRLGHNSVQRDTSEVSSGIIFSEFKWSSRV